MFDLVIRQGKIVDGSGLAPFQADIGIRDGLIKHIGRITGHGTEEIDAKGLVVTPGFIDGHTHLDAAMNWDPLLSCSSWHGVTTVVMGNCGFTLAPCRKGHESLVVRNLERAEDISAVAMSKGIDWQWETFSEYLSAMERLPRGINTACNLGHSALRTWAMGERAFTEEATEEDITTMREALRGALRSGAIGFTTSRSRNHETSDNRPVASRIAAWSEIQALVDVMREEGTGIFELSVEDAHRSTDRDIRREAMGRMRDLAIQSGVPVTFGLTLGNVDHPSLVDEMLEHIERVVASGGRMFAQSHSKGVTLLLSFETALPFDTLPEWRELRAEPLSRQAELLKDPEVRKRLIKAADGASYGEVIGGSPRAPDWTRIKVYDRELPPFRSVGDLAKERNMHPVELMIELALKKNLKQFFLQWLHPEAPEESLKILSHPLAVMTFSDSGAHVSQIADSSLHTHFLAYWVNCRKQFSLEKAVQMITLAPARAWGFSDRGLLREGMAADLNLLDIDALMPLIPELVTDLPGGARRLIQRCEGIKATIVNGVVLFKDRVHTGSHPGKMLRSRPGLN
jgi:N-acyl-D-amino-acid deacylase